jgi:hypothetical protein
MFGLEKDKHAIKIPNGSSMFWLHEYDFKCMQSKFQIYVSFQIKLIKEKQMHK